MQIQFNIPAFIGNEEDYIHEVIASHSICGDSKYTKKCNKLIEETLCAKKVMLTTSGSSALDMAVMLCDIRKGDEVILPSYTFSSSANAIILSGGIPVFVDIRPDTMNIDENMIEKAITEKTKAIMVVHYAGVSCEMDMIMSIAEKHGLKVIEDAAQAFMSKYKYSFLGTIGDFGCFSFHETKNLTMGEGGAIVINDEDYIEKAEILREKGTDRSKFYRGEIDKYTWIDKGDSFLPSDINAAYLYPQLLKAEDITNHRIKCWNRYYAGLIGLASDGYLELPTVPDDCKHNGHIFYIKVHNIEERTKLISFLKSNGIGSVFHYIPLHSAPAGKKYCRFNSQDRFTTAESEKLLRLPMHYKLTLAEVDYIVDKIRSFYG